MLMASHLSFRSRITASLLPLTVRHEIQNGRSHVEKDPVEMNKRRDLILVYTVLKTKPPNIGKQNCPNECSWSILTTKNPLSLYFCPLTTPHKPHLCFYLEWLLTALCGWDPAFDGKRQRKALASGIWFGTSCRCWAETVEMGMGRCVLWASQ